MKNFFNSVGVTAISSVLPRYLQSLDEEYLGISRDAIDKIIAITGINKVAIASQDQTASDLAFAAAEKLRNKNPQYLEQVDVLLFVSQTRDYVLPNTSILLQERLGLSRDCLCLDIPNGCTGYIYGLYLAATFISSGVAKKVLLLCAETNSKLINAKDKSVSMIFGDGASATVISNTNASVMYLNIKSSGIGFDKIIVPHGGSRHPMTSTSLEIKEYENNNMRRLMDLKMDGMSVFNFAITDVPRLVSEALQDCSLDPKDINLFAAHQANRFIVRQLAKKCSIDSDRSPFMAENYGNTGPASIPLLITDYVCDRKSESLEKVLMCGFGVGLSWGVCLADLSNTEILTPAVI